MSDPQGEVTRILAAIEGGDREAADRLIPLVYSELRRMAQARVSDESASQAPQATSLVHQAYLRLLGDGSQHWNNRAHFFGAAAEAMRRILVDRARERRAQKRGGDRQRVTLDEGDVVADATPDDVLAIDQALARLEAKDRSMAEVVKLRYFVGLSIPETAEALDTSPRSVDRSWAAARAWLLREMRRK